MLSPLSTPQSSPLHACCVQGLAAKGCVPYREREAFTGASACPHWARQAHRALTRNNSSSVLPGWGLASSYSPNRDEVPKSVDFAKERRLNGNERNQHRKGVKVISLSLTRGQSSRINEGGRGECGRTCVIWTFSY